MTRIPRRLLRAYRSTVYRICLGRRRIALQVGRRSHAAETLIRSFDQTSGVFITAHNPWSEASSRRQNDAAQRRLIADLRALKVPFLPGAGVGRDHRWPAEQSLFAIGLDRQGARDLGRRHRQNAVVYVALGRPVALLTLR